MLSLPSKPWKKVKLEDEGEGRYAITILSRLRSRAAFEKFVRDDLGSCLGAEDTLSDPRWKTGSVTLRTRHLKSFKRKLIYANIVIETD